MKKWIGLAVLCIGLIFGSYVDSDGAYRVKNNGQIIATPYASINAAVAAAGTNKETLVVDSSDTLAANLTIPSTLTLKIPQGGMIVKASTYTLAINGPFESGLYQVFSGFDAGDVTFAVGIVKEFYPQWWGAKVDDSTDDTVALQLTVSSLPSMSTLFFTGVCKITGELNFSGKKNIILRGNGWADNSGALAGTGGSGIHYAGGSSRSVIWFVGASYITIQDMEISSSATTPPKVVLALGRKDAGSYGWHKFDHIRITGYATHALVYSIASEVNAWDKHSLQLVGGGAKYVFYTSQEDDLSVSSGDFFGSTNLSLFFNNFWVWNLVDDVDAAAIYINGRGSTGDMYFRNGSGGSQAGAHVQINVVNDADDFAQGPYVFDSIRLESTGTTKYGIKLTRDAGTVGALIHKSSFRDLCLDATDAIIYGADDLTIYNLRGENLFGTPGVTTWGVDVAIMHRSSLSGMNAYSTRVRTSGSGNFFTGATITLANTDTNTFVQSDYAVDGIRYTGSLELDMRFVGPDANSILKFRGNAAAGATKLITTTQGDGVVTGPQLKSATPGWLFVGMVRISVNGTDYWTPYYSYVP